VIIWNRGISFGSFGGTPYSNLIFLVIATLICCFLLYQMIRAQNVADKLILSVILGGAVGNIMDRIQYNAVLDFIDFHIYSWHWYVFNVADAMIVSGLAILLIKDIFITGEK
jgi:lipoprotein signal peptidase